jgi:PAS domain S-box-containing protein
MIASGDILRAKILIVDDQEVNILLLEQILGEAGYTNVTSTRGPFPVRDLHRKNRYDLILLDLQMPGLDGFEVMESLKEIEPGAYLPVLVVTAQPDHRKRALKAGAKDFISKPFDVAELLHRVHVMLEVRLLHAKMTGQDVRGLMLAEEARRQNDERFKLAARLLNASVWDWNLVDQSLWWSDGFLTPFGYAPGEVEPGVAARTEFVHPDDRDRVMDDIRQALEGADTWTAEYRFKRKDGGYSGVEDHGFILRDVGGLAVRMVGGLRSAPPQKPTGIDSPPVKIVEELNSVLFPLVGDLKRLEGILLSARAQGSEANTHSSGDLALVGKMRASASHALKLAGEMAEAGKN